MDERDLVKAFFEEPPRDDAAKMRARARLQARMRRRPRRAPLAVAAALAICVLAGSLIWSGVSADTAAARGLQNLAEIPLAGLEPGPGEYLHSSSTEFRTETTKALGSDEYRVQVLLSIDTYVASDGSGLARSVVQDVSFPSTEDEAAWSTPGAPLLPAIGDERTDVFAPGEGPLVPSSAIPDVPETVLDALLSGQILDHGPGDAGVFEAIGDLLAQGNLPQAARATLLGAAARLEDVRLLGTVRDPAGREGQGYAVRTDGYEARLIFDPRSGQLLATETLVLDADGTWHVVDWVTLTTPSISASVPALP